ncbi:hypothetical protein ACSAZL_08280 [Methanosarcina sp. T3]|uniref:hypothetical protein n=1 Tax=Methanosarcina sp. T3 TaxID=3439062 RepID=UPI003F83B478
MEMNRNTGIMVVLVFVILGGVKDWMDENYILSDTSTVYPYDHGARLIGADGHRITLLNYKNATDVTKDEVLSFITSDKTDQHPYTSQYKCGDFAEDVHNNAEKSGIRCGYVLLDGIDHVCNVFNTTDYGLIFIDCTHGTTIIHYNYDNLEWSTVVEDSSYDSIVKVEKGKQYKPKSITTGEYFDSMGIVTDYTIYW